MARTFSVEYRGEAHYPLLREASTTYLTAFVVPPEQPEKLQGAFDLDDLAMLSGPPEPVVIPRTSRSLLRGEEHGWEAKSGLTRLLSLSALNTRSAWSSDMNVCLQGGADPPLLDDWTAALIVAGG